MSEALWEKVLQLVKAAARRRRARQKNGGGNYFNAVMSMQILSFVLVAIV